MRANLNIESYGAENQNELKDEKKKELSKTAE